MEIWYLPDVTERSYRKIYVLHAPRLCTGCGITANGDERITICGGKGRKLMARVQGGEQDFFLWGFRGAGQGKYGAFFTNLQRKRKKMTI